MVSCYHCGFLGNKTIRIINQVPADLKAVSADPQRLEQVLYNLIAQAKAAEKSETEMKSLTEGLGLPADFKMPF